MMYFEILTVSLCFHIISFTGDSPYIGDHAFLLIFPFQINFLARDYILNLLSFMSI